MIALRRPADYSPEQGARFEVHLGKARSLSGAGALPFEARLEPFESEDGRKGIRWLAKDLKPPVFQRAAELFSEGYTVRQVAVALGISRTEAGRLRLTAVAEGLFESPARRLRQVRSKRPRPMNQQLGECPLWLPTRPNGGHGGMSQSASKRLTHCNKQL